MTNGVPQRSVVRPLFVIDINDLDVNVRGMISEFADDMKVDSAVHSKEGCVRLPQDMDQIESWPNYWQMEINPIKCKVADFRKLNKGRTLTVEGR